MFFPVQRVIYGQQTRLAVSASPPLAWNDDALNCCKKELFLATYNTEVDNTVRKYTKFMEKS